MENSKLFSVAIFGAITFLLNGLGFAQEEKEVPRFSTTKGLRIVSPANGAVYSLGDTVEVHVETFGDADPIIVSIINKFAHFQKQVTEIKTPPFTFQFQIPNDAAGKIEYVIMGQDKFGEIYRTQSSFILVDRGASVESLRLNQKKDTVLSLGRRSFSPKATVTFADGYEWKPPSSQLTFISGDPSILSIEEHKAEMNAFQNGEVTITVSYGGVSDTAVVSVKIPPNVLPPVAKLENDKSVQAGEEVTLLSRSGDEERYPITYSWTQLAGELVQLSNPNSDSVSFIAPNIPGDLTFQLIVNDGDFDSKPATINVTVLPLSR